MLDFQRFARCIVTYGSCPSVAFKKRPSCAVAEAPGFVVFASRFADGNGAARILDRHEKSRFITKISVLLLFIETKISAKRL